MGKIKDLRNHKIKTILLWPRVLLMTLFFCVFAGILILLLVIYCQNVLNTGVLSVDNTITSIVNEFDSSLSITDAKEWAGDIEDLFPEVKSILLIDDENNVQKLFGNDFDSAKLESFSDDVVEPYLANKIYFNSSSSLRITYNDGDLYFIPDFIQIIKAYSENANSLVETAYTDLWFIYSIDATGKCLAFEYHYSVAVSDVIFVFLAVLLIVAVFIILTIYNIFSFINLFKDKRRIYNALFVDMVTGGRNWLYFKRAATKLIKSSKKGRRNYVIIQLRVEKYRSYCAVNGVKAGEKLVEDLNERMNDLLDQKREIGVHYERADFALMLLFQTEMTLKMRLDLIIDALAFVRPNEKLYFSLGIVKVTDYQQKPDDLYNLAGVARAVVTEDSSNRIAWYNEKMAEEQAWNNMVENEMQKALDSGQFKVFLQPKYTPRKEELGGAEALIRWQRPGEERLVPPGRFIPIFERNGFITKIDDFMISEVSRLQSKWLKLGYKIVPVSVNLSRVHFSMPDLAEHILHLVDQYDTPHEYIELELTESAFFDDKKALLDVVDKLHSYNFKVSMDDFGAGYSSLNSLKELPLDVIKIDAEFFRNVDNEERSNQIVRATINLAKQLKMDVVAEGVEERQQVDFLAGTRCDLIQGYYFAKPMPNENYEEILAEISKPQRKTKKTTSKE